MEEYYHKKFINQLCRKLKNTKDNFKRIRYNFTLKYIYYREDYSGNPSKEFKLKAQLDDIYAEFSYESSENNGVNENYDSDFLDEDVCEDLFHFLDERINWDLFLNESQEKFDYKTDCPVI